MFRDTFAYGDGEPFIPTCRRCNAPIGEGQPVEEIRFDPCPERKLEEMNGTYHAHCAQPYLSIARALRMLQRSWF